jgi:hypothetical protein
MAAPGACLLSLVLSACVQPAAPSFVSTCSAPLVPALEVNLYFGRDRSGGGEVSEAEWASFLAESVTPRFPAGLTVIDARGQHRDPQGRIGSERTKLVVIVVFDAPAHREKVRAIVDSYRSRFGQHGVFRVEQAVCAGE